MEFIKVGEIYHIKNTITGEGYIGSSKNHRKRYAAHLAGANINNNKIARNMREYGPENFTCEFIADIFGDRLANDRREVLREFERQFMESGDYDTRLNQNAAYRTKEENSEYICWYKSHRITCACGCDIRYDGQWRHRQSARCRARLSQNACKSSAEQ